MISGLRLFARAGSDRGNCEFWPSRVPTYPHSQLAARSAAIPTYPPSGAEFRERPPSRRAQWYLPTLARCLPAPRPYLPTLAQVFPIAAVTYLPGRRGATLGLHYTITHTYNAGQCTHIYLESSNTPTALRRPRHGSGPSTPGPGSAWASPRERPPRSLAPALVPKEY